MNGKKIKNKNILVRVEDELKKEFYAVCKEKGVKPSKVIRELIKGYTKEHEILYKEEIVELLEVEYVGNKKWFAGRTDKNKYFLAWGDIDVDNKVPGIDICDWDMNGKRENGIKYYDTSWEAFSALKEIVEEKRKERRA